MVSACVWSLLVGVQRVERHGGRVSEPCVCELAQLFHSPRFRTERPPAHLLLSPGLVGTTLLRFRLTPCMRTRIYDYVCTDLVCSDPVCFEGLVVRVVTIT